MFFPKKPVKRQTHLFIFSISLIDKCASGGEVGDQRPRMHGWVDATIWCIKRIYRDDISQLCVILHTLSFTISLGPWQCPCGAKGMLRCVVATRWWAVRKWTCSVLGSWLRPKCRFGKTQRLLCGGLFAKNAKTRYFFFLNFNLFLFYLVFTLTGPYREMIHYNHL